MNPRIRHYRHVLWDWNGTLFDDAHLCVDVLNNLLRRRGLAPITPRDYETDFDFPVIDYYRRIGFDFEKEPFQQVAIEFLDEYDRRRVECNMRRGAREVLLRLADLGYEQSILSAYEQSRLEEMVDRYDLRPFFSRIAGLDNIAAASKVDVGRRLIADLKCDPADLVMIGDTTHDRETAEAMGIDCLLIHSGHHCRTRLQATGADVLESLIDLIG